MFSSIFLRGILLRCVLMQSGIGEVTRGEQFGSFPSQNIDDLEKLNLMWFSNIFDCSNFVVCFSFAIPFPTKHLRSTSFQQCHACQDCHSRRVLQLFKESNPAKKINTLKKHKKHRSVCCSKSRKWSPEKHQGFTHLYWHPKFLQRRLFCVVANE